MVRIRNMIRSSVYSFSFSLWTREKIKYRHYSLRTFDVFIIKNLQDWDSLHIATVSIFEEKKKTKCLIFFCYCLQIHFFCSVWAFIILLNSFNIWLINHFFKFSIYSKLQFKVFKCPSTKNWIKPYFIWKIIHFVWNKYNFSVCKHRNINKRS